MRLIFLDFDGVLHPCTAGTLVYIDRFEAFLRKHPSLHVVIASTWRLDHSWADLQAFFSPDLRGRLLGVTPEDSSAYGPAREREINSWRQANRCTALPWVALDDDASLFTPGCPNLVLCETIRGLRQAQLSQIEAKLALKEKGPF